MKLLNAKTLPRLYYGLHMVEGVAEYKNMKAPDGGVFRVFVGENAIKSMDSTFQGRPVYVHHKDEVNLETIQAEADGYVVRSFFNPNDGKHWAEFMVVSDRGHEAIRNGWKLSNAYNVNSFGAGGKWHSVEYTKEVISGEYEHLAIVPDPRYNESIILTPDEFKAYNEKKKQDLIRLSNSEEKKSMFNFFKKQKVENSDVRLEDYSVVLPKSKKEVSIATLVNEADEAEVKKDEKQFANGDHMVKVGEEEMSVNSLLEKFNTLSSDFEEYKNTHKEQLEPVLNEEEEKKKKELENEEAEKKKKEELENAEKEKAEKEKHLNSLKNAEHEFHLKNSSTIIETSHDMVQRGKNRYGSSK